MPLMPPAPLAQALPATNACGPVAGRFEGIERFYDNEEHVSVSVLCDSSQRLRT